VVVLVGSGTDGGHHGCAAVASQTVLQQPTSSQPGRTCVKEEWQETHKRQEAGCK
jgi:hypothetical protein